MIPQKQEGRTKTEIRQSRLVEACPIIQNYFGSDLFQYEVKGTGEVRILKAPGALDGRGITIQDLWKHVIGESKILIKVLQNKGFQNKVQSIVDLGRVGIRFARLLEELKISPPPAPIIAATESWLARAIAGEVVTIVAGVCPDYSHKDGSYTFESVGGGVGLVGQRILQAFNKIHMITSELGLKIRFAAIMADFEADDQKTCEQLGVSCEEFRLRMRYSQTAFALGCIRGMPIHTPFATELANDGQITWRQIRDEALKAVSENKLSGPLELSEADLKIILKMRTPLYQRWFGSEVDVMSALLSQVPDYMTLATAAEKAFGNILMVGGDSVAMSPFLQGLAEKIRPTLYLPSVAY